MAIRVIKRIGHLRGVPVGEYGKFVRWLGDGADAELGNATIEPGQGGGQPFESIIVRGPLTATPLRLLYVKDENNLNHVFSWMFNFDDSGQPDDSDQPTWSENVETRYVGAPPLGQIEKHWNYQSLDRLVAYRPFNFDLDLNNHCGDVVWHLARYDIWSRLGSEPVFRVWTDDSANDPANIGIRVVVPANASVPFSVHGGNGNVIYLLNAGQAIYGQAGQTADAGNPTRNGVSFWSRGFYWDGAAQQTADAFFTVEVGGNNDYTATIQCGWSGAILRLRNNKLLEAPGKITSAGSPVMRQVAVPGSASAAGEVGDWASDDNWLYKCTATNTWKRTAVTFATW